MLLSIVSPVYKAEKILPELVKRIEAVVQTMGVDYELILVNDRSPDNSWNVIQALGAANPKVKGLNFSRNFGQHFAITAGLDQAKGDAVVVMDCDLQDDPKYIPELLAELKDGIDIVYTKKQKRKHSFIKNMTAGIFFRVFNYLADGQVADSDVGNYTLLSRKAVDAFCRVSDVHRHYLMILRWMGFGSTSIAIEHQERFEGKSSYNARKLISHAINGITSQSDKLLRIAISLGMLFFMGSIVATIIILIGYFKNGALAGWTSLMILVLLSTGLILMAIGILGIYIGKIFDQVKERPIYLIQDKINC